MDELLLRRVLYGISCRNYESAAESVPGAIGLSSSSVSRGFVEASAAKLREMQERDLSGEDVVAMVVDGKTFADATMVLALGITLSGDKRFLGFVETDTENERVLRPFLLSLVERGLDISQGRPGGYRREQGASSSRDQGVPQPRRRSPLPMAQARERGESPGQKRTDNVAQAVAASLRPTDVQGGVERLWATSQRA